MSVREKKGRVRGTGGEFLKSPLASEEGKKVINSPATVRRRGRPIHVLVRNGRTVVTHVA
jgi:hypothetical protein